MPSHPDLAGRRFKFAGLEKLVLRQNFRSKCSGWRSVAGACAGGCPGRQPCFSVWCVHGVGTGCRSFSVRSGSTTPGAGVSDGSEGCSRRRRFFGAKRSFGWCCGGTIEGRSSAHWPAASRCMTSACFWWRFATGAPCSRRSGGLSAGSSWRRRRYGAPGSHFSVNCIYWPHGEQANVEDNKSLDTLPVSAVQLTFSCVGNSHCGPAIASIPSHKFACIGVYRHFTGKNSESMKGMARQAPG